MAAAHVQSKSIATDGATATSIAITFTATGAVASGNLVCGMVVWGGVAGDLTSIDDDKSNTYTIVSAVTLDDNPSGGSAAVFYKENITNGPITITAHFGSAQGFRGLTCHEASGLATASALDKSASQIQNAPGTGTNAVTSTAVTTTTNGQYIFGACSLMSNIRNANEFTAGTGYVEREEQGDGAVANLTSESQVQTSAGSIAATFTASASAGADDLGTFILTFKTPAAGTTLTPTVGAAALTGLAPSRVIGTVLTPDTP